MRALVATVSVALIFASCGAPAAVDSPSTEARGEDVLLPPASERIYVRDADAVRAFEASSGKPLMSFAAGATTIDWKAHYAVEPDGQRTVVRQIDPRSARTLRTSDLSGEFQLPSAYGAGPSGLSPQGTWLVLAGPAREDRSAFVVVDTKIGSEKARIELPGKFSFDAINESGSLLYLIEHPRPGSTAYNVRPYDLRAKILMPPLTDVKPVVPPTPANVRNGLMTGTYHSSVAGKFGWLFSLYFHPTNGAFIHALNIDARTASCILDLPKVSTHQASWSLVMDQHHDRLYAVNAAVGVLAVVNTRTLEVSRRSYGGPIPPDPGRRGSAVLAPNGALLCATSATGIWVINTHDLTLKANYLEDRAFRSIAISADGQRLYGIDTRGGLWLIEAGTGRPIAEIARIDGAQEIVRVE